MQEINERNWYLNHESVSEISELKEAVSFDGKFNFFFDCYSVMWSSKHVERVQTFPARLGLQWLCPFLKCLLERREAV